MDSTQISVHRGKPERTLLIHNYPNPFNDWTHITLDILNRDRVRLTVYNPSGQEVNVLLDAVLEPGRYPVQWRGMDSKSRKLPSGVYLCVLEAGSVRQACKLTFLR